MPAGTNKDSGWSSIPASRPCREWNPTMGVLQSRGG